MTKPQRQRAKRKAQQKAALRFIASKRSVSLAVASAILSGMPRKASRKIERSMKID